MLIPRIIPCLLLKDNGLVKGVRFKDHHYVGDPINAIKIFNEKEVDELFFLDILATEQRRQPAFEMIEQIASECFMPVCYGGGIRSVEDIRHILSIGIEKVSMRSYAAEAPEFVTQAADTFGSQSIVVSVDVTKDAKGHYKVFTPHLAKRVPEDPVAYCMKMERLGAGELLVNAVDRDGTMEGYDIELISAISEKVSIPVVACGGAGKLDDIREVIMAAGASAAAAGSLFVFFGKLRAVLINYPKRQELETLFQ